METKVKGWMVLALLLGTMAYAIAEEITLTPYYPSPRGVYNELRLGSGSVTTPTAKLQVTLPTAETGLAFRVDDEENDATPFTIDQDGNITTSATLSIGLPAVPVNPGFPSLPEMLVHQQALNTQAVGLTKGGK